MREPEEKQDILVNQKIALEYLWDSETIEVIYGGAAGGGKSRLGCLFLVMCCYKYPGTRYLMARGTLKDLIGSTLVTMLTKVLPALGLEPDIDYTYISKDKIIFHLGNNIESVITLNYLGYDPSDPEFSRLGGTEYTACFVDECNEIGIKAWDILKSRTRDRLTHFCHNCAHPTKYSKAIEFIVQGVPSKWLCANCKETTEGLMPKLLGTCNPSKNWIYELFYKPYVEHSLPPYRKFVKALAKDNPHNGKNYAKSLATMYDEVTRNRLLNGLWEFSNDPADLCDYDSIMDCFSNDHVKPTGNKRLSADLAMQGRDHFVVALRDGDVFTIVCDESKSTGKSIEEKLRELMNKHCVSRSNIVADSDGMGGYLASYLVGIKTFRGNGKSYDNVFVNLKAKCAYKLAEKINKKEIRIICTKEQRAKIVQELGQLKSRTWEKDETRKAIITKEDMKASINRSPDYLDALIMSMYWDIQPKPIRIYEGNYSGNIH